MKKLILLLLLGAYSSAYAANLPDVYVEHITLNNVKLDTALNTILKGTGIQAKVNPKVNWKVSTNDLSGYLVDVVELVTKKSDVNYRLDGKSLFIEEKPNAVAASKEYVATLKCDTKSNSNCLDASKPQALTPKNNETESDVKIVLTPVDAVLPVTTQTVALQNLPVTQIKPLEDVSTPTFTIKQGQLIAYILKDYLEKQGFKLFWNASMDMESTSTTSFKGDVESVLDQVFKQYRLTGWIVNGQKSVYVK